VEAAQQALQIDPLCSRRQEELSELSNALKQIELWKIEGQQVRARVQWKSRGDSSTKEFYKAVKPRVVQARITELLSSEGVSCFEQEQLEGICFSFFSKLYQGRLSNPETGRLQEAVLGRIQPKLSDEMIESLKAPLKLEEFTKAVGEMAKTKAPGPDGIITEFYQTLWPVIGRDYWQMAQEAIRSGSFPKGVTEGVISLLYKGGTRNTLNSWRPITLLNTSYKVFAKTLQLRLQPILMEVISPDQSAFLPLRFILDNIFLTHETIAHAKKSRQSLMFLKLDFSKAYDRVDLAFLFRVMERLGFPSEFINMSKLLFRDARACVSVNGRLTEKFTITQGVRQGCPLAPYLFLIIGEVLNMSIKAEASIGHIRGITLPGTLELQIILQYADDSSLTLRGEEPTVVHTVSILNQFSEVSGLTLNWSKSRAYWWSSHRGPRPLWTTRFQWLWARDEELTTLLGSPFGLTLSTEQVDQFLVERIEQKINYWATVRLNSTGRAVIANGVLVSSTLYFLSIWAGSKARIRKVISKVRNYLFSGTAQPARARVAWSVVCSKKREGGLNIVNPLDAVIALMSKWVVSACEPGDSNLKKLMQYRLSCFQPYSHGGWNRSLEWFSHHSHKASPGSKIWNRMA
jgi:hypothetical protein